MPCLVALAGVLCGGGVVGIPIYLGTMSITGPLNCLLAGPVTGCLTPLYSGPALAMGCVGGELSGILSCLMGPCGPLVPVVAGAGGGVAGCVGSTLGCMVTCPLNFFTSCCGPCCPCSPCIGLGYALVNVPITTLGGILTGVMGGCSGPLLGLVGGIGSSELCGFLPAEAGIPGLLSGSAVGALTAIPRAGLVIAASTVGGPIGIVLATIAQACVGLVCGIGEGFGLGFCAL